MSWKQRRFGGCKSAEEAGKSSERRAQRILVLSVVLSERRARLQPDGGFLLVAGHRGSRTNQKQNLSHFIKKQNKQKKGLENGSLEKNDFSINRLRRDLALVPCVIQQTAQVTARCGQGKNKRHCNKNKIPVYLFSPLTLLWSSRG